jgi:hypothetical protein
MLLSQIQALIDAAKGGVGDLVSWTELKTILEANKNELGLRGVLDVPNTTLLQAQSGSNTSHVLVSGVGVFVYSVSGTPNGTTVFSAAGGGFWTLALSASEVPHAESQILYGTGIGATSDSNFLKSSNRVTIQSDDSSVNNSPLFVRRNISDDITSRAPILTLENIGNNSGSFEFSNETHLRLKAGSSGIDRRRYILFTGFDNVDDWVTGANKDNNFVLFDAINQVHRETHFSLGQGGHSDYASVGTGIVRVNNSPSDQPMGTGGFEVFSGGPYASLFRLFRVGTDGMRYLNQAQTPMFLVDQNGQTSLQPSTSAHTPLTIKNAAGGVRFVFSEDGKASINGGIDSISQFAINRSVSPASGSYNGFTVQNNITVTADNSSIQAGAVSNANISGINRIRFAGFYSIITNSSNNASTQLEGGLTIVTHSGTGNINQAKGLSITLNQTNPTGTITTGFGLHINSPSVANSIATLFGARIEEQGAGKWGLYVAGTANSNYFGNTVAIGTTSPNASTILDVASTTKASRPHPSMTTAQMLAITPGPGFTVYNTTESAVMNYDGTRWTGFRFNGTKFQGYESGAGTWVDLN